MNKRERGRPPREWRWLVHDVDRVRKQRGGSVLDACSYLAAGGFPDEILPIFTTIPQLGGVRKVRVVWGRWAGMKAETLEREYYRGKLPENKFRSTD